jgi:hypothetical protein
MTSRKIASRSMQHLNRSKTSRDKNSIYVKSNKSSDNKIESMIIKKGDRLISVKIDGNSVKVSLHGAKEVARQTISLDAFQSLDTQVH